MLTVGESLAVNSLLNWLLERGVGVDNRVPSAVEATEAARLLADHARNRLHAGIFRDDVPSLGDKVRRT